MHETFDHTADLGLRIRVADLETLFVEAAQALFAAILENPEGVRATHQQEIQLPTDEREYLLFDWLNTLLYHFDSEHMVFTQFEVHLDEQGLRGVAHGEPLDRTRHELSHEVKAITYHGLKVEPTPEGGWLAEIIVDI